MRCVMLSHVACPALRYFSTAAGFSGGIERQLRVLTFSTSFALNISHYAKQN
jgi:hypothetical protein